MGRACGRGCKQLESVDLLRCLGFGGKGVGDNDDSDAGGKIPTVGIQGVVERETDMGMSMSESKSMIYSVVK